MRPRRAKKRITAAGMVIDSAALVVHTVPMRSAKSDEAKARRPGVRGSSSISLICDESSPTMAVKSDMASIVPMPNATCGEGKAGEGADGQGQLSIKATPPAFSSCAARTCAREREGEGEAEGTAEAGRQGGREAGRQGGKTTR
jgi:hypothetical protein